MKDWTRGFCSAELLRIIRFGLVGGLATLVHASVYAGLAGSEIVAPLIANLIAFAVAVSVSFIGHLYWTFHDHAAGYSAAERGRALGRFIVTATIGLGLNSCFVWLVVDVLRLSPLMAVIPMVTLSPAVVYLLGKHWAFSAR